MKYFQQQNLPGWKHCHLFCRFCEGCVYRWVWDASNWCYQKCGI